MQSNLQVINPRSSSKQLENTSNHSTCALLTSGRLLIVFVMRCSHWLIKGSDMVAWFSIHCQHHESKWLRETLDSYDSGNRIGRITKKIVNNSLGNKHFATEILSPVQNSTLTSPVTRFLCSHIMALRLHSSSWVSKVCQKSTALYKTT